MCNKIVLAGATILFVGAVGVIFFTVLLTPKEGLLDGMDPACLCGICISRFLYRLFSAISIFMVSIGIAVVVVGLRARVCILGVEGCDNVKS